VVFALLCFISLLYDASCAIFDLEVIENAVRHFGPWWMLHNCCWLRKGPH